MNVNYISVKSIKNIDQRNIIKIHKQSLINMYAQFKTMVIQETAAGYAAWSLKKEKGVGLLDLNLKSETKFLQ